MAGESRNLVSAATTAGVRAYNDPTAIFDRDALLAADPLHADPSEYDRVARRVLDFRDKEHGGVIRSMDDLKGVVADPILNALKQSFYTSDFGVRSASS